MAKTDRSIASTLFEIASKVIVYPFFRRKAKPGQVSDLAQDAMMKAWVGLKTFRGDVRAFFNWLRRICFNCLVSLWRSPKNRRDLEELDSSSGPTIEPDTILDTMEILELDEFSLCRSVADGLSYEQLAEMNGCCVGTIKSRLHRQRNELESLLLQN